MYYNINNNMEHYCMYLRKSRKDLEAEMHGEGETLKRHEEALKKLYKSMGISENQIDTYREIVSGETIASRPVIQNLLELVQQGIYKGCFVFELERLARGNTLDQGIVSNAFQYSNTLIITPMKIYDPTNEFDQEYFEFGLFMSRREYKTINRRLQNGRNQSASEGKFVGSHTPYGYEKEKIKNDKGYTLKINPSQADTIKLIYDLYVYQNMQPSNICKKLDSLNIKPMKSEYWSVSSIRDILLNPIYTGKIRWKNRKSVKKFVNGSIINTQPINRENDVIYVEGLHPPIIDEHTFELAKEKRKSLQTCTIPSVYNLKNPLSGLLICAKCKKNMTRQNENIIFCKNNRCDNISSKIDVIEDKILDSLRAWLHDSEDEINNTNLPQENNKDIILLKQNTLINQQKELAECNKKIEKIHDFLEKGIYSVDVFTERRNKILENQKSISKNIEDILSEIDSLQKKIYTREEFIPNVKNVLKTYHSCTNAKQKNILLKTVIEKIEYLKTEKCYNTALDNFELLIYPKL